MRLRLLIEENAGVITLRQAGDLTGVLRCLVRSGELVRILPGTYATSGEHLTRLIALSRYAPDAIVTGRSAAALTGWPELAPAVVTAAVPTQLTDQPGFRFTRRRIDPEWVQSSAGIRCTNTFLTAVELIPELGGDLIDDVLRAHPYRGTWALDRLWQALRAHPDRPGNRAREQFLTDSRDRPWSQAERVAHRLLREAGITGWRTNHHVVIDGRSYFLDLAFPALRVGIEINGYEWHSRREVFESDHARRNAFSLTGWQVLEFTWRMVTDDPERFLAAVLQAIESPPR